MQLDQLVSVVIRLIAGFYVVKHVAQLALSSPALLGVFITDASLGASSLLILGSLTIIAAEIAAFARSRALAQWLLKGA